MRKTILMLILCAPLAWIAWREGQRLYDAWRWSPQTYKVAEGQQPSRADLEKIKKAADEIVDLPDGAVGTIVRLDPPPPGFDAVSLDRAVREHVRKRAQGRKAVDDARLETAGVEKDIEGALKRIRGNDGRPRDRDVELTKLKVALDDYERLNVRDLDLLTSARAEEAWPKLEREHPRHTLDNFYKNLDGWSPGASDSRLPGEEEVKGHADAYRKYLEDYRSAKGAFAVRLVGEARERLVLWVHGAKVVQLLRDPAKSRLEQVDEIGALAEDNPPERFEKTARQVIQALCGDLLKTEPLDEIVLLTSDEAEPEPVPRKEVKVEMKNGETIPLGPPQPDEYSLQVDQIKSFSLPMGRIVDPPGDAKVAPLKGTKYSDAIRAFNTERDRIKHWSEPVLKKLRETCEAHATDLARGGGARSGGSTLIKRIDSLLEIVVKHPNLFVNSVP
jgi:hypothetical protein